MPGPGLVVVMLAPIVAAGALVVLLRHRFVDASPLRALWLVPVVVLGTIVAMRLQQGTSADDALVNRGLSAVVPAVSLGFVWANRWQRSRLVRAGVWLTAAGAAGNAIATLVYGFMPVFASSASWIGPDIAPGSHPDPQYVAARGAQWPALLLGDVLPVPGLDVVVSLGDLLLVPGCTILLASVLAAVFLPQPEPSPSEYREGVTT